MGKDLFIYNNALTVIIINSKTTMDIEGNDGGGTSKVTTCTVNNPCTGSFGSKCVAASSGKGGVVCSSYPACPWIYTAGDVHLKDTDGWNVWSESCKRSLHFVTGYGKTVKIKKSSSMSGELVIDRGATSESYNRHFLVYGTLELEDVTLKGGHAVSSFVFFVFL